MFAPIDLGAVYHKPAPPPWARTRLWYLSAAMPQSSIPFALSSSSVEGGGNFGHALRPPAGGERRTPPAIERRARRGTCRQAHPNWGYGRPRRCPQFSPAARSGASMHDCPLNQRIATDSIMGRDGREASGRACNGRGQKADGLALYAAPQGGLPLRTSKSEMAPPCVFASARGQARGPTSDARPHTGPWTFRACRQHIF